MKSTSNIASERERRLAPIGRCPECGRALDTHAHDCSQPPWFVYLVRCADNSYYCGITNDLARRVKQHNDGKGAKYTRSRRPVTLVRYFRHKSKRDALRHEYRIKQLDHEHKARYDDGNYDKHGGHYQTPALAAPAHGTPATVGQAAGDDKRSGKGDDGV